MSEFSLKTPACGRPTLNLLRKKLLLLHLAGKIPPPLAEDRLFDEGTASLLCLVKTSYQVLLSQTGKPLATFSHITHDEQFVGRTDELKSDRWLPNSIQHILYDYGTRVELTLTNFSRF